MLQTQKQVIADTCLTLQQIEKQRRIAMRLFQKNQNGIEAAVASNCFGYHPGLPESERTRLFGLAREHIKAHDKGEHEVETVPADAVDMSGIINLSKPTRDNFSRYEAGLKKGLENYASKLHVADWMRHPDRHGISFIMLGTVIGESGDLYNYPNPGKLWKRLVGAPYEKNGEVHMPSTWRKKTKGGLTREDWIEVAGPSPQRPAATYQIRINIVRQNKGPYRKRYEEAKKKAFKNHPEWGWKTCSDCKGKGCETCLFLKKKSGHAHQHAMLLALKLFLKDLWLEWWGDEAPGEEWRNRI